MPILMRVMCMRLYLVIFANMRGIYLLTTLLYSAGIFATYVFLYNCDGMLGSGTVSNSLVCVKNALPLPTGASGGALALCFLTSGGMIWHY